MIGAHRKIRIGLLASAAAVGTVAFASAPAQAQTTAELQAQLQAMQAQMNDLQRQIDKANARAASANAKAASANATAASAKASADAGGSDLDLKVKWKGAPELSSGDGKFKFKVRGRINLDYGAIDQDRAKTGENDVNAVELRRGRIGIEGHLYYDWKYKAEVDFGGDETAVKDAYLAYANWAPWKKSEIILGNHFVANSLEEMTSSRFITFLERAAFIEAFELDRRLGAGIWVGDKHWSFQTGYYGATPSRQEAFFDDETAASVRGTIAPINTDTTVLHLGASYRHRNAGTLEDTGAADLIRYRARGADLHLADRFVATPMFGENDDMFNLEGAIVYNRFSVQGEYAQLDSQLPSTIANVSPTYDGWYISGSAFLTDDMRNYKADTGGFGRQKVNNPFDPKNGGWGAWEVAGRYDVINLADGAAHVNASTARNAVTCDDCGDQETWLIGLNWWINDYTALKLNYNQSEISGGANDGATISGFGMRAQIDW
ncbi:MAG: porin [Methyloceanibacter sp.]|uniref:OprO/OprP family phosphate-selective porin n=1 Tax=Methyloceanibacter sp. TaxID=1965321 RepID=UPI003C3F7CB4